jgi:hypothetical protein
VRLVGVDAEAALLVGLVFLAIAVYRPSRVGDVFEDACDARDGALAGIARVVYAIQHLDLGKIERTEPIQARDVDAALAWIRAALMVRVYPALRTEIMLCRSGVELIDAERIGTGKDINPIEISRHRHRAAHPTIRTITASRRIQAVRQPYAEAHGLAVASSVYFGDIEVHGGLISA